MSLIHPIVCSVCGGRGFVEAGGQGPASWVILTFALILCALGLGGGAAITYVYYLAQLPQERPIEPDDRTGAVRDQTKPHLLNVVPAA
jgi:hypothetical protein